MVKVKIKWDLWEGIYCIPWYVVDFPPPIKINILKVTSGEINAYTMKLLRMLRDKRKVKEEERIIVPWVFQLFPFFATSANGSYSPNPGLMISSPPISPNQESGSSFSAQSRVGVFLFSTRLWLTNQVLNDTTSVSIGTTSICPMLLCFLFLSYGPFPVTNIPSVS